MNSESEICFKFVVDVLYAISCCNETRFNIMDFFRDLRPYDNYNIFSKENDYAKIVSLNVIK